MNPESTFTCRRIFRDASCRNRPVGATGKSFQPPHRQRIARSGQRYRQPDPKPSVGGPFDGAPTARGRPRPPAPRRPSRGRATPGGSVRERVTARQDGALPRAGRGPSAPVARFPRSESGGWDLTALALRSPGCRSAARSAGSAIVASPAPQIRVTKTAKTAIRSRRSRREAFPARARSSIRRGDPWRLFGATGPRILDNINP